jgi:hypothetical protein
MGRILDALTEFFRADGWNFSQLEGRTTLIMTVNGAHGTYTFFAQAREEQEQVAVYSVYGVKASEAKRVEAMEYITRANYGLIIGNFEMDLSDGEVRYKTSLDVEGETLTPGLIRLLVAANVATADRYLPGFMLVLYGNRSAADAIHEIEG